MSLGSFNKICYATIIALIFVGMGFIMIIGGGSITFNNSVLNGMFLSPRLVGVILFFVGLLALYYIQNK